MIRRFGVLTLVLIVRWGGLKATAIRWPRLKALVSKHSNAAGMIRAHPRAHPQHVFNPQEALLRTTSAKMSEFRRFAMNGYSTLGAPASNWGQKEKGSKMWKFVANLSRQTGRLP